MPQAYRLLSFNFDNLTVESPQSKNPVDVTPGRVFQPLDGILLNQSPDTLDAGVQPEKTMVRITFAYEQEDLVSKGSDTEPSFLLKRATLKSVEFQDQELQDRFGHLFSADIIQQRRAAMRRESLQDLKGRTTFGVVRAMDARSLHTHAMDYVYLTDPASLKAAAAAVVRAYEEGDESRTTLQRVLRKTLDHAVTTAVYEQQPQHVAVAVAPSSSLFRAPNEGEFFYDSPTPLRMQPMILVNEHGEVSLPVAKKALSQEHEAVPAPV